MKVEGIAWLGTRTERFDETISFFSDVLGDEMHRPETVPGYGWFHVRGPDGNVYALVQGSKLVVG